MPKRTLTVLDGTAILVGIVIGMGIFGFPSLVAGAAGSAQTALWLWAAGGVISLLGALTYAELAASYPDKGGEYHFLSEAYDRRLAFVFGWARLTVIQTGTIAGGGFIIGDYLTDLYALGPYSAAVYAAIAIVLLTLVQLRGLQLSTLAQNLLSGLLVIVLLIVVAAGFLAPAPVGVAQSAPAAASLAGIGFAMIFVLYTYGGWNEAAYLSGEMEDVQKQMARVLLFGVGLVTLLYLGVNWAYLHVLGFEGVRDSKVVGADLMRAAFGEPGALLVTLFVVLAAASTINGTLFTGGRSGYAVGRDFPLLGYLGRWSGEGGAPVAAILTQCVIALGLVLLGALTQKGLQTMVDYTAPVFWLFFLLTGLAAIVLRLRDPARARPFKTPLFPLIPLLFCAAAGYMLYSSVTYAVTQPLGIGARIGIAVLAFGMVLALVAGARPAAAAAKS
jgi:basic amino acid/polyamine antiporter, APA family